MVILIVDDDRKVLKFLYAALTRFGHQVITTESAIEALAVLSQMLVNVIITDINMPDMDGIEFCQEVRKSDDFGHLPILVLTAQSSVDDVATGFSAGADDYLMKPIHLEELLRKIHEHAM